MQGNLMTQDNSTLSEVTHKNKDKYIVRRTKETEARRQHSLTWKAIQDMHNNQDEARHIQEAGNEQTRRVQDNARQTGDTR